MINRFTIFLGPFRLRALFFLLAGTGLLSLILNAVDADWVVGVQTLLVLIFVIGAALIIGSALPSYERGRWLGILLPSFGLVVLGTVFIPDFQILFYGGALGWIIAGLFVFNPRAPMQYKEAVRYLRRSEFADAVKSMDTLIKEEPDQPNHYRFRAEILRVWGKIDRAKRDYRKMTQLAPDSAVAFNGLAEVCLQAGDYDAAHEAALRAYELAPGEWVASYNLGMIEDRLEESDAAIMHLQMALQARAPDARHRLLIHFYLIRAYSRKGDMESASAELEALKRARAGLDEWQKIFNSEQSQTLRDVIAADVQAAEALINDEMRVEDLSNEAAG